MISELGECDLLSFFCKRFYTLYPCAQFSLSYFKDKGVIRGKWEIPPPPPPPSATTRDKSPVFIGLKEFVKDQHLQSDDELMAPKSYL